MTQNRDSSVGIVIRLSLDRGISIRFTVGTRKFSPLHNVQINSRVHRVLFPMSIISLRGTDVELHEFLVSALDRVVSFTSRPLYPGEIAPSTD
jgi:hypothetical protein